jgi:hypothetical protein
MHLSHPAPSIRDWHATALMNRGFPEMNNIHFGASVCKYLSYATSCLAAGFFRPVGREGVFVPVGCRKLRGAAEIRIVAADRTREKICAAVFTPWIFISTIQTSEI